MRAKERVRMWLARVEPDRVPIDYAANPGIDARLKAHFGLGADDDEGLRQALGVDFRGVQAPHVGPRRHASIPERGVEVDIWGIHRRWVTHESGGYWDYCDFPLQSADEEAVARWPLPSPDDFDYGAVEERVRRFSGYGLSVGHPGIGDIINANGMLRGMEQTLLDLITDDPAGLLLARRRTETNVEILRRTLEAAKGAIDFLWMGEDLGTQIAPIIGMDLYRRHIRPLHQRFVDLARSFEIPVMIHCCGSSSWAFGEFADMGMAAVDTLQPEAKDMAPRMLKQRYGGRLAFHGMISTAGPLASGDEAAVVGSVRETLDIMMPGGGYALAPTHQIQDNTPTANAVAMYATAQAYGRYA